ncbi:Sec-independent protein translocase subunit TatA [Terrabacter sp. BE26]|uniref:Sec-independent protein translocase subunit TatA n=1 Tax=Terrabacter sp. BE26 TaxID=2898152 RepID=UPI0035BE2ECD
MADLGWPELAIIALAVVLLFGWKRMPDMARSLGRSARIFKSEMDEMRTPNAAPPTPDPATEADLRATAAEAEAARLREELETRRHGA